MRKPTLLKSIAAFLLFAAFQAGCGVKAPPLPPNPVTPQQADQQETQATPSASPSPLH